jgi:hypothetical protein
MSTPLLGSVHTIKVSAAHVSMSSMIRTHLAHALLFLETILLANPSLKEKPVRMVFGFYYDAGLFGATFDLWRGKNVSMHTDQ